jgi:hypothetical protein
MYRFMILFISIIWASLLLLSWGSPTETAAEPAVVVESAS